mgnify:CR=1 FL=1
MTTPHERMRALRWGYELVHSVAIDESLPETLRSRALAVAVAVDYPAPEVIEQVRSEGLRGLEPSAVEAFCNARRLFQDVARTKDLSDLRRRDVQGTLRHFDPDDSILRLLVRAEALRDWLE